VASFVIPTRKRVDELRDLLLSVLAQTVPVEVLVMDDGDSPATAEMLRTEFPSVKHFRLGYGRGPAFQRNRGIELASNPIVFPVDDDTLFPSPHTVAQTLKEFENPRVAAVGIPFINVRQDDVIQQRAPNSALNVVHAFVGAAHAVRRDIFNRIGGYREHFFYMGEEGDLCLRLLDAGYVTILGSADAIHHFESPHRDFALANRCGRRNDILFAWHNVPLAYFPFHLAATTLNGMIAGVKAHHPLRMLKGTVDGYLMSIRHWRERRPVSARIYRLQRHLKKYGARPLAEIEGRLLPIDGE
jgi:GT2 family glycosyltransferase